MFFKCFRGECMRQLWKNLKGWWCGNSNVNSFDYFLVSWVWGPWVYISLNTIICGMTYSKYLCQSLYCHLHFFSLVFLLFVLLLSAVWLTRNICANLSRCHLRFFHSSFYCSFSFSWEKIKVIFLHCRKMEADLKKQYLVYGIFFWPETWRGSLYIKLPPLICQIPDFNYWTVLIFILIYFEWRDTENQSL